MTNKKQEEKVQDEAVNKQQEVAKKIQDVLEASGMALQPYLDQSAFGIVPRVQLVEIPNEINDEQGDNQQEAGTDKESKGVAEPTKS